MNDLDSIFDGLLGYEKLMLICGFVLFVFALAAITLMIVQRRDFRMAMVLIVLAIVLMGFPGIQAIKFSKDMVELDRIRARPTTPTSPEQQEQARQTLMDLQRRAEDDPTLLAKVSDGYRAIGEVDQAYRLAQQVLAQKASPEARAALVPVLTAKLNQVQAGAPIESTPAAAAPPPPPPPPSVEAPATSVPAPSTSAVASAPNMPAPASTTTAGAAPAPAPAASAAARQRQIAVIASQLQGTGTPLPAASHAALAKAYVILDEPQKAQANIEAARRINPDVRINPKVLRAAGKRTPPGSQP